MLSLTSSINSPYHKIPVWLKLALLVVIAAALFVITAIPIHIAGFCGIVLLYTIPGPLFFVECTKKLWPLVPFIVVLVIWNVALGTINEATVPVLRLVTVVGFANLLTMTTRIDDMMGVLEALLKPFEHLGFRTRIVTLTLALVIRFIPNLLLLGERLAESWTARSVRRPSWKIAAPLAALAIDDAEHVAEALRARGGIAGS